MRLVAPTAFTWKTDLPRFRRICLEFPRPREQEPLVAVRRELERLGAAQHLGDGKQVAITAGSRGITSIPDILSAVAKCIRDFGGRPIVMPAMGSHGGATAEGQVGVLKDLGIVAERIGAPILASMEVVEVGRLPGGMPVFLDCIAAQSDAVIVINRIKPHTDFSGEYESGLAKMAAVGLGKQRGAEMIHRYGLDGLRSLMPQAARMVVQSSPFALGLAVLENAYHETAEIRAVPSAGIAGPEEAKLLQNAYRLMPHLPFEEIDVLIVDEIGKNISGTGMDTKVIGRVKVHNVANPVRPDIHVIAALRLAPESHGNAVGIGLADVTTQQLVEEIDFDAMYINGLTSGITGVQRAALPVVAPDDRRAILTALRVCGCPDAHGARIVRIRNTLELDCLEVSDGLLSRGAGVSNLRSISEPFGLRFDSYGRLLSFGESG